MFLKPPKKQDHSKARKEIQNEPPKIQKTKITTFLRQKIPVLCEDNKICEDKHCNIYTVQNRIEYNPNNTDRT